MMDHEQKTTPAAGGSHRGTDSPHGTGADTRSATAVADPTAEFSLPESWTRIMGLRLPWFLLIFAVVVGAVMAGAVGNEILPGFALLMLIGGLLHWIGGRVPVLRNYGLPTVLCILTPAVLLHLGLFPQSLAGLMESFTSEMSFIDFYVASLIAGSILWMPRALLLKAGARIAVPLLGTIVSIFALIGLLGHLLGFGLRDAVLFVAAPIMGGGVGAGIVPMSQIYADQMGGDPSAYISQLIPAVVIANCLSIFCAGAFNGITYKGQQFFVGFNGNGQIVRVDGRAADFAEKPRPTGGTFQTLAVGLIIAATLYLAGSLIAVAVPGLPAYAWTILLAAAVKIFGLMPESFEDAVTSWYGFVSATLTPALLVGISIAYFEFDELGLLLSDWRYPVLVVSAVVTAVLIAGTLGWLVKMYFVESSIAVGMGRRNNDGMSARRCGPSSSVGRVARCSFGL